MNNEIEQCRLCNEPTGRCGEDSIYVEARDGITFGPLCVECLNGIIRWVGNDTCISPGQDPRVVDLRRSLAEKDRQIVALKQRIDEEVKPWRPPHRHNRRRPGMGRTHPMRRRFWKAVSLFAYRRWIDVGGVLPTGIPGHRDPEAKCSAYAPHRKSGLVGLYCSGDGHYLCKECANFEGEDEE